MINIMVAIFAPIVNCIHQVPQLIKIIKTKSVDDISLSALILLLINNILWFLHGYFIADTALIVSSVINLMVNIPLIYYYYKHKSD